MMSDNVCKNCRYLRSLSIMKRNPFMRQVRAGIEYGIEISECAEVSSNCCIQFMDDPEAPIYEVRNIEKDRCENFKRKDED